MWPYRSQRKHTCHGIPTGGRTLLLRLMPLLPSINQTEGAEPTPAFIDQLREFPIIENAFLVNTSAASKPSGNQPEGEGSKKRGSLDLLVSGINENLEGACEPLSDATNRLHIVLCLYDKDIWFDHVNIDTVTPGIWFNDITDLEKLMVMLKKESKNRIIPNGVKYFNRREEDLDLHDFEVLPNVKQVTVDVICFADEPVSDLVQSFFMDPTQQDELLISPYCIKRELHKTVTSMKREVLSGRFNEIDLKRGIFANTMMDRVGRTGSRPRALNTPLLEIFENHLKDPEKMKRLAVRLGSSALADLRDPENWEFTDEAHYVVEGTMVSLSTTLKGVVRYIFGRKIRPDENTTFQESCETMRMPNLNEFLFNLMTLPLVQYFGSDRPFETQDWFSQLRRGNRAEFEQHIRTNSTIHYAEMTINKTYTQEVLAPGRAYGAPNLPDDQNPIKVYGDLMRRRLGAAEDF